MYKLYLEKHEQDILEKLKNGEKVKPIVKYEFFSDYFNKKFNLSFGNPKSDTCQTCDRLQNLINAEIDQKIKLSLIEEKEMHKKKADIFYSDLKKLSLETKENPKMDVLSFDYHRICLSLTYHVATFFTRDKFGLITFVYIRQKKKQSLFFHV